MAGFTDRYYEWPLMPPPWKAGSPGDRAIVVIEHLAFNALVAVMSMATFALFLGVAVFFDVWIVSALLDQLPVAWTGKVGPSLNDRIFAALDPARSPAELALALAAVAALLVAAGWVGWLACNGRRGSR